MLLEGKFEPPRNGPDGLLCMAQRMIQDIQIMKQFEPECRAHLWAYPNEIICHYELYDKYGIYVVAEANIKSHGMGYDEKTLARIRLRESAPGT